MNEFQLIMRVSEVIKKLQKFIEIAKKQPQKNINRAQEMTR